MGIFLCICGAIAINRSPVKDRGGVQFVDTIVDVQLFRRDKEFLRMSHHIVIMIIGAIALEARPVFVQAPLHLLYGAHGVVAEVEKFIGSPAFDGIMVEDPDIRF